MSYSRSSLDHFPMCITRSAIFDCLLRIVQKRAFLLIAFCTAVIFTVELNFPIGFAPWLPYFVLAFALSRLSQPRTLLFGTALWSLAIMGEPLLHSPAGNLLAEGVFNRTLEMITLWILAGLLYADIVARRAKQASESRLKETATFIESLFDHLPNMVFVKDAKDLRFVWFNKAGEELIGYSRSELLGKNDHDFFTREEADFFTNKDRETLSNRRLTDIPEETIQTKSKGMRILHTKKIPICDSSGAPQYLLGISEDVTERKEAEATLVRARLAAEEANKAKSDFLANMSHEMRTPLNAIIGITDFLTRTRLSPEQLSLVQRCTKASEGLLRLIDDLLLASKAESGTLQLVAEPFVLRDLVTECTNLMSTQAREKRLILTVHLNPTLPIRLVGDVHRLQQVLLNLIRNAIKFTNTGSIEVRVTSSQDNPEEGRIQFAVVDTGIGISRELHERIFERFTQADSRFNRQYGGVGLGLSICKQLVELMGGRIWVEGNQSRGSTFLFRVPLKAAAGSPTLRLGDQGTQGERAADGIGAIDRGLKILLAEDFSESQDVMRLYLRETAHQLDCVATGADAVICFQAGMYDLVFMDLQMPQMDGYAATREIRAWESKHGRQRTPIVALTANGLNEARQASRAAGCDDFLTKPIKMETILQAIRRHGYGGAETAAGTQAAPDAGSNPSIEVALAQLKPKFFRNRRHDVSLLRAAVSEQNFAQIETIGHRIKGLAGSYGLHEIGDIGGGIEEAALSRDLDRVTFEVSRLLNAVRDAEDSSSADSESHAA